MGDNKLEVTCEKEEIIVSDDPKIKKYPAVVFSSEKTESLYEAIDKALYSK